MSANQNSKLHKTKMELHSENKILNDEIELLRIKNKIIESKLNKIESMYKDMRKTKNELFLNFVRIFLTVLIFGLVKPLYHCCFLYLQKIPNICDDEYIVFLIQIQLCMKKLQTLIETDDEFNIDSRELTEVMKYPNEFIKKYIDIYTDTKTKDINEEKINDVEFKLVEIFQPVFEFLIKYEICKMENIALKINMISPEEITHTPNKIKGNFIGKIENTKQITNDSFSTEIIFPYSNQKNINENNSLKKNITQIDMNITESNQNTDTAKSFVISREMKEAQDEKSLKSMNLNITNSKSIMVDKTKLKSIEGQNLSSNKLEENNIKSNSIEANIIKLMEVKNISANKNEKININSLNADENNTIMISTKVNNIVSNSTEENNLSSNKQEENILQPNSIEANIIKLTEAKNINTNKNEENNTKLNSTTLVNTESNTCDDTQKCKILRDDAAIENELKKFISFIFPAEYYNNIKPKRPELKDIILSANTKDGIKIFEIFKHPGSFQNNFQLKR